ncbi:MAG: transposase [Bacillota bacterium]
MSFHIAYYNHFGRHREFSLYSMLSTFILQKILGIPTISLMINILRLSKEIRDFCGFSSIPNNSQFTRCKSSN